MVGNSKRAANLTVSPRSDKKGVRSSTNKRQKAPATTSRKILFDADEDEGDESEEAPVQTEADTALQRLRHTNADAATLVQALLLNQKRILAALNQGPAQGVGVDPLGSYPVKEIIKDANTYLQKQLGSLFDQALVPVPCEDSTAVQLSIDRLFALVTNDWMTNVWEKYRRQQDFIDGSWPPSLALAVKKSFKSALSRLPASFATE